MSYEDLPPQRKDLYLQNAERAADEAAERLINEMGGLAMAEAEVINAAEASVLDAETQQIIQEAETVRDQGDISMHFNEAMTAASGGIEGFAAGGRATEEDLVNHANLMRSQGKTDAEIDRFLAAAESGAQVHGKAMGGRLTAEELAHFGNRLTATNTPTQLLDTLISRAENPKILDPTIRTIDKPVYSIADRP